MRNKALKTPLLAGLTLLAGTATYASVVSAATSARAPFQLATAVCHANNPANQQFLWSLLSGLRNTTTSNVSVVCASAGDDLTAAAMTAAVVYFRNDKPVGGNVSCTLAAGTPKSGQTSFTKSVYVPAGANNAILWTTSDYGSGVHNQWVNIQCSLPPGWTIQEVGSNYAEDIGT